MYKNQMLYKAYFVPFFLFSSTFLSAMEPGEDTDLSDISHPGSPISVVESPPRSPSSAFHISSPTYHEAQKRIFGMQMDELQEYEEELERGDFTNVELTKRRIDHFEGMEQQFDDPSKQGEFTKKLEKVRKLLGNMPAPQEKEELSSPKSEEEMLTRLKKTLEGDQIDFELMEKRINQEEEYFTDSSITKPPLLEEVKSLLKQRKNEAALLLAKEDEIPLFTNQSPPQKTSQKLMSLGSSLSSEGEGSDDDEEESFIKEKDPTKAVQEKMNNLEAMLEEEAEEQNPSLDYFFEEMQNIKPKDRELCKERIQAFERRLAALQEKNASLPSEDEKSDNSPPSQKEKGTEMKSELNISDSDESGSDESDSDESDSDESDSYKTKQEFNPEFDQNPEPEITDLESPSFLSNALKTTAALTAVGGAVFGAVRLMHYVEKAPIIKLRNHAKTFDPEKEEDQKLAQILLQDLEQFLEKKIPAKTAAQEQLIHDLLTYINVVKSKPLTKKVLEEIATKAEQIS